MLAPINPPSSSDSEEFSVSLSGLSRIQHAILNVILSSTFHLTQQDISSELQIPISAVGLAMRDEKFKAAYESICNAYSHARYREVIDKITDLAVQGSAEHAKIYLKVHKVLHDKAHETPPPSTDSGNFEELQRRKREIENELKVRFHVTDAEVSEDAD